MTKQFLVIKPDNSTHRIYIPDEQPTLAVFQQEVGGYIEIASLPNDPLDHVLIVNEDGISMELPPNPIASYIALTFGRPQIIRGNVILARNTGENTSPPAAVLLEGLRQMWDWTWD